jgi:hypothetical protein
MPDYMARETISRKFIHPALAGNNPMFRNISSSQSPVLLKVDPSGRSPGSESKV